MTKSYQHNELLTEEEKEYLREVQKRLDRELEYIVKYDLGIGEEEREWILVEYDRWYYDEIPFASHSFPKGTKFKKLVLRKEYKPEELGL